MFAEAMEVTESRRSLQVMHADLDSIEEQLQLTNRRFIKSRPSAWARARATTAIYLANIRIQSRFKFWLLPDQDGYPVNLRLAAERQAAAPDRPYAPESALYSHRSAPGN